MSDVPRNDSSESPSTSQPSAQVSPSEAHSASPASTDVVLLGPPTADGNGVHILRARDQRLETGELRALVEGRPIAGEIVTLKPRESNPRICDVTASYAPEPSTALTQKGPAKVANRAYRDGWDEIFGPKSKTPGPAN